MLVAGGGEPLMDDLEVGDVVGDDRSLLGGHLADQLAVAAADEIRPVLLDRLYVVSAFAKVTSDSRGDHLVEQ
ncbi:MAG TPA: hypothetical protein VK790_14195 [Solirubrobacteraceae bacterium]|nr:hypothetical protein [Solirubrobacteraceae bacterium]